MQSLGCVVCRNECLGSTPAQVHHILRGSVRIGHDATIPLCGLHHNSGRCDDEVVSRHPWRSKFEEKYGKEADLLKQIDKELEEIWK